MQEKNLTTWEADHKTYRFANVIKNNVKLG